MPKHIGDTVDSGRKRGQGKKRTRASSHWDASYVPDD